MKSLTRGGYTSLRSLVSLVVLALLGISGPEALAQPREIVNLSHLDWLHDTVPYPAEPPEGHATTQPGTPIDAWWTYANYDAATDTYERIGGGAYDAATNTWSQRAFNLDDVARAAVVYLTHYRYYGNEHSLEMGYGALRFVLYIQTLTGPNAGNFVLWMQSDGQLNPTPMPPDGPNPADAGFSWWAARAMWALAKGYAAFKEIRPDFAEELASRMTLAMQALERQVLAPSYGSYRDLHGYPVPAWFIRGGADASSIAVLGLTRYYEVSGDRLAARLATQLAEGLAQFQFGDPVSWPFQAHLPSAGSLSLWHAWGARMGMALAEAGRSKTRPAWIASAEREANSFLTHLLVATGPIHEMTPAPTNLIHVVCYLRTPE